MGLKSPKTHSLSSKVVGSSVGKCIPWSDQLVSNTWMVSMDLYEGEPWVTWASIKTQILTKSVTLDQLVLETRPACVGKRGHCDMSALCQLSLSLSAICYALNAWTTVSRGTSLLFQNAPMQSHTDKSVWHMDRDHEQVSPSVFNKFGNEASES